MERAKNYKKEDSGMCIEESIARVRTEVELYNRYSKPTPFVKDIEELLTEIDKLTKENEAFLNTTRFRNLEEENVKLKLEQIGLLEEMSALLEDRPLSNGEYIHVLTCNASRLEPVGNEMCSCPIGRRIKVG